VNGRRLIRTQQYNCTKDNFPPGAPEEFQRAGITAFVYDPRSTGKSGGFPRNDIDPFKQTEDYSDAFTYLSTLPVVDVKAVVFWGISMSAGIALSAAAVDRRIAAVIAIAPIFKFVPVTAADAQRLKTKLMKDRESQTLHGNPPYMLPIGESLAQMPFNSHVNVNQDKEDEERKAKEEEERRQQAEVESGHDFDPTLTHNPNGTTIQSYHRMFLFEPVPKAMVQAVAPTPVMFLTPELDTISPPEQQKEVFNSLKGPKRLHVAPGKDHIYVLHGPTMPMLMKWQIDFVWQVVRGHLTGAVNGVASTRAIQPNGLHAAPKQDSNIAYA
jgi:pimeloyl-ACP methyl ester carboxylesterase